MVPYFFFSHACHCARASGSNESSPYSLSSCQPTTFGLCPYRFAIASAMPCASSRYLVLAKENCARFPCSSRLSVLIHAQRLRILRRQPRRRRGGRRAQHNIDVVLGRLCNRMVQPAPVVVALLWLHRAPRKFGYARQVDVRGLHRLPGRDPPSPHPTAPDTTPRPPAAAARPYTVSPGRAARRGQQQRGTQQCRSNRGNLQENRAGKSVPRIGFLSRTAYAGE